MRYVVEYILNTPLEWAVWMTHGMGTKTGPMTEQQFVAMDKERESGKYVFFKVEVIRL